MKILIIGVVSFLLSLSAMAESYSMRRCMLLPVTDTAGNSLGFKIYEELENYLKTSKWCEYTSSNEVLNIFTRYRDRLKTHLQDEAVVKSVIDRLKVGTAIRVGLVYDVDKINITLDVIGENGADIYLSEKTVVSLEESEHIVTTIINWLEQYESNIPYDGKVVGVLGEQVTITVPKSKRIGIGQDFKIKRLVRKKRHPLLKKVVEWDSILVAKGKIFNISQGQALGQITLYTTNKKVQAGDWIRLGDFNYTKIRKGSRMSQFDKYRFGKLGEVTFSLGLTSTSSSATVPAGSHKHTGLTYGIGAKGEMWVTRNYFAMGEFTRFVGNLSKSSGSPDAKNTGLTHGVFKFGGGYKYLPMGFFYGPQINFYGGWANYSYTLDKSAVDGYGEGAIKGLFLGLGANVPVQKGIRAFANGEIMPFPDFEDTDNLYGSTKSISSLAFELGAQYQFSSTIVLSSSFKVINNTAKFSGNNSQISFRTNTLNVGGKITF